MYCLFVSLPHHALTLLPYFVFGYPERGNKASHAVTLHLLEDIDLFRYVICCFVFMVSGSCEGKRGIL